MLQEAVERDPRNSFLKGDLIRVEGEINGVDAAVAKARASAAGEPENNIYDLVSAELYEKAGRIPDAIAVLEKAVAARPSDEIWRSLWLASTAALEILLRPRAY